jgi:cytochrome c-type biogenesis protein CcmH/NrfF
MKTAIPAQPRFFASCETKPQACTEAGFSPRRLRTNGRALLCTLLFVLTAGCSVMNPVASDQKTPTQGQVESELTCQCGCGLTVHTCNHLSCSSGEPLKVEISEQISSGKNLAAILAHFENKYGEIILSAPTMRGFNLAAWVIPFVMLGMGGIGVGMMLRGWLRSPKDEGAEADTVTTDPGLRARLEEELDKFDRRS